MKKSLLAIAVGAALAAPGSAMAHAQLYGKINLSLDRVEPYGPAGQLFGPTSDEHRWELTSNKSYLGFRGEKDLDVAGLSAIYQLEYGIYPDESLGAGLDVFTSRNTFLGLKSGFGTLKAGRFNTPLRELGFTVDQFHDQVYADNLNLMAGEWRASNIVQYSTPQIAELLTFNVATIVPEGDDVNDSGVSNTELFDSYSASIVVDGGIFHAGAAYDHNNYGATGANAIYLSRPNSVLGASAMDIIRLTGGVDFDMVEVGVLLQEAETRQDVIAGTDKEKEETWLVSVGVPLGQVKLKAQYGETDPEETDDADVTQYSVGADYKLADQSKAYVYGTNREVDGDRDYSVWGVGMEHRF